MAIEMVYACKRLMSDVIEFEIPECPTECRVTYEILPSGYLNTQYEQVFNELV